MTKKEDMPPPLEPGKAYCGLSLPASFYFTPDSYYDPTPEEKRRWEKERKDFVENGGDERISKLLGRPLKVVA